MLKITVQVDGMMCGMCEAHVNDAVRKAFPVKKVTSSHSKGETVILTENDIEEAALHSVINATGYEVKAVTKEPYEKIGYSYLIWTVVNWYDAFVIDCLWVCHDRRVRIPGTEDMKEYQDYWFHIKGSLNGQVLGLPVALLAGGLTAFMAAMLR